MRNSTVMLIAVVSAVVVVMAGCHSPAAPGETGAQDTAQRATLETYVFSIRPSWTDEVQRTKRADPGSFGQRMVILTARAPDGRHVVLVQSPTYNRMFRRRVRQGGAVVYTSPNGFKVWGGGPQKWYAGTLLRSARAAIKDPPAEDRIGYVLESPAGTFPALAVNGPVTDEELHRLVDSLVPDEECPSQSAESPHKSDTP
jgi:hypothetical protein